MDDVFENFNEKVEEIDQYFDLLEQVSSPTAKIHIEGKRPKVISSTALKTMKASCFLMLYNLVESSIRESLTYLYEKMNDESKKLSEFQDFVRNLWFEQVFKRLDPFTSNQTSYRKLIREMVEEILQNSPVSLDPEKIHISGNLDAKEIRNLFDRHRIPLRLHYRAFHGGELRTVKDKRNSLAHGDESFSYCGQQYAVSALIDIKKQTIVYLRSTLRNIKKYAENSGYAA